MKKIVKILAGLIGLAALLLLLLILWLTLTDYRPAPEEPVEIVAAAEAPAGEVLTLFNWNIGYGGLGKDMDFFMDGGTMIRPSEEVYARYRDGILKTIGDYRADVYFFQEMDRRSTRSYKEDQAALVGEVLKGYSQAFASNYKVKYIPSPRIVGTQYGAVHSGLSVYSQYAMSSAVRYALPGNYPWPRRIFFLDRCMLVTRIPAKDGREWVMINTHNAAYDKGGYIKAEQLAFIRSFASAEYEKGNCVVIGGDWNNYMPGTDGRQFPSAVEPPEYYQPLPEDWTLPGWSWGFDPAVPTNRSLTTTLVPGETFTSIIDGFLVSPNVEILRTEGIDLGFEYSDHNPLLILLKMK